MIEQLLRLLSGDLGQRIGWSLLHFLWQGVAVAALLGRTAAGSITARAPQAAAHAKAPALPPVLTITLPALVGPHVP